MYETERAPHLENWRSYGQATIISNTTKAHRDFPSRCSQTHGVYTVLLAETDLCSLIR
jgi:hypothetical protein